MANFSIIVVKRVSNAVALILAVVILNFLLIHIAPGDIVDTIAGEMGGISPELIAQIRADYGLDKPLYEQLAIYVLKILQGDLGYS